MNLALQIAPDARRCVPGDRIVLEKERGFVVEGGRVEVFLIELRDGAPASRRHFLCEVKTGNVLGPPAPRGVARYPVRVQESGVEIEV